jgi:hypothetical protein
MGKQMTVGEAVRKYNIYGYEFVIENGEVAEVSFSLADGTEFVLPEGVEA